MTPAQLLKNQLGQASNADVLAATATDRIVSPSALNQYSGKVPNADDGSIDTGGLAWNAFAKMLNNSVNAGTTFSKQIVSTYPLIYTVAAAYHGGVLAKNGDIHFVPRGANKGQKVSSTGVVSTYSLVYTVGNAYIGGVLAPNGDIHFVPMSATVGQKINSAGNVSTYSLVYTVATAYAGGVLAPNGDIHFVPLSATVGQKINSAGNVSTYSLVYTVATAYAGGVLAPNGDIHFIPRSATVGQKINTLTAIPLGIGTCCSSWLNKF
jgi:hypothetical protein